MIVYIDLDGVLADLEKGMEIILGYTTSTSRDELFKRYLPHCVDADGFARSPVMPGADNLVSYLFNERAKGSIELAILTSAGDFYSDQSVVAEQKKRWLYEYFPQLSRIPFCVTSSGKQKALLAHPGAMLIDDHQPNIDAFRAAGGVAQKYPEEWNDV